MTPQEETGARLLAETYARWDTMPPVNMIMSRVDAQAIILALQGMATHPQVTERLVKQWEHIGRQIMETICDTPEIYAMLAAGWNRDFDVDPEEAEGQRDSAGVHRPEHDQEDGHGQFE